MLEVVRWIRDLLSDLEVYVRIIIKRILDEKVLNVWVGLNCIRIDSKGRTL